jgi:hypothetical protein
LCIAVQIVQKNCYSVATFKIMQILNQSQRRAHRCSQVNGCIAGEKMQDLRGRLQVSMRAAASYLAITTVLIVLSLAGMSGCGGSGSNSGNGQNTAPSIQRP